MSAFARATAVAAGIVCLLLATAELVRQAALAADPGTVWPAAAWWERLTSHPSPGTTWIAAAVVAALAVLLLALAALQWRGHGAEGAVGITAEGGDTRLSVAGVEQALARRVRDVVPGAKAAMVSLRRGSAGWLVRVEAAVPARDVAGARVELVRAFGADLERMGGMQLAHLDLVVTTLLPGGGA